MRCWAVARFARRPPARLRKLNPEADAAGVFEPIVTVRELELPRPSPESSTQAGKPRRRGKPNSAS